MVVRNFTVCVVLIFTCTIILRGIEINVGQTFHPSQLVDKTCGLTFPWLVWPFLDVLKTWDMHDWDIFEFGAGCSTGWFAHRCKSVTSVDHNQEWLEAIADYVKKLGLSNSRLKLRSCISFDDSICSGEDNSPYPKTIDEDQKLYDCIIVDGYRLQRNACVKMALKHVKNGGIIILDNVNQRTGNDNERALVLLKNFQHHIFYQPPHFPGVVEKNWRTDYWVIETSKHAQP